MRSRKIGWLIAAAVVLVFTLAAWKWVAGRMRLYSDVAATLPAEIAAARREGIPLAPADLVASNPVPDASNAAPYYARLKIRSTSVANERGFYAVLSGKATEKDRAGARHNLAVNTAQIQIAEQGAALPDCDFHHDWSLGLKLLFPEYGQMRSTVYLLAARATLECDAGQPEAALHDIAIGARMAHHAGQDPAMDPALEQTAMESVLSRPFMSVIKCYGDRPNVLALAAKTDQEFGALPDLRHALGWDVVLSRAVAETIRTTSLERLRAESGFPADESRDGMPGASPIPASIPRKVMIDVFEARTLSYWRRVFAAIDGAKGDNMAAYRALKAVDDAEQAHIGTKKTNPTYELSDMRLTETANFALKLVDLEMRRRMRETVLALLQYRNAHGAFPGSLALLRSDATLDPYIDQPLKYRLAGKGFTLYSVGENLKDDGGVGVVKQGTSPLDIVITYP